MTNWQYYLLVTDKRIASFLVLEAVQNPYQHLLDYFVDLFHSILPLSFWVNSARLCNRPKILVMNSELFWSRIFNYLAWAQFVWYEICTFFLLFVGNFWLMEKVKECVPHIFDHVCRIYRSVFAKSGVPILGPIVCIAIFAKLVQLFP